jgi:hypothetical protein
LGIAPRDPAGKAVQARAYTTANTESISPSHPSDSDFGPIGLHVFVLKSGLLAWERISESGRPGPTAKKSGLQSLGLWVEQQSKKFNNRK